MSDLHLNDNQDYKYVLDAYYNTYGLISHNIDSYNKFINHDIKHIINQYNPYIVEIERKSTNNLLNDIAKNVKYIRVETYFDGPIIFKPQIQEITGHHVIDEKTGKIREKVYELYPQMARNNNLTYQSSIHVKVSYKVFLKDANKNIIQTFSYEEHELEKLGDIPVMVRSCLCNLNGLTESDMLAVKEDPYDLGGYFIMKGSEKVIISQERRNENHLLLFHNKTGDYEHICQIKSIRDDHQEYKNITINVMYKTKDKQIYVSINPGFGQYNIPIALLFKALGIETDIDIAKYSIWDITNNNMLEILKPSLQDLHEDKKTKNKYKIRTQNQALLTIADRIIQDQQRIDKPEDRIKYIQNILNKYLFPHVVEPIGGIQVKKAKFLGFMTRKLILGKLGILVDDDRDDFSNKRIDTAGPLLLQLYRHSFQLFLEQLKKNIEKEFTSKIPNDNEQLAELFNRTKNIKYMSSGIASALMRGIWKSSKNPQNFKVGVAQLLQRKSWLDTIANLRRIFAQNPKNTSIENSAKIRQGHVSTWGKFCITDTPDGGQTGLVKNLAATCNITLNINEGPILSLLNKLTEEKKIILSENIDFNNAYKMTIIMINGLWYGVTDQPHEVVEFLREKRRQMYIDPFISITWKFISNEIIIHTDAGRCVSPVYRVGPNNQLIMNKNHIDRLKTIDPTKHINWKYLLDNGIIEFLDVQESENNAFIALYPSEVYNSDPKLKQYTHCEIHPSTILSSIIGLIPFSDHNQSPRNIFQSSMCKQAICVYSTAGAIRMDTSANTLHYSQRPLVTTYMAKHTKYDNLPHGQNVIVAIAMYTGYNQEDSLIVNKSSVDRGLFNTTNFKTFKEEAKNDEKFTKPDPTITQGMKNNANYAKLNSSGIVPAGTPISKGDVLIGKIHPLSYANAIGNYKYADSSYILKDHAGKVERILTGKTGEGNDSFKITIRKHMEPRIGDKLCLDTSTEILTNNGWKQYNTFDIDNDKVATYNPQTKTINYIHASGYYVYKYDPEIDTPLIMCDRHNINFCVSSNHKMYVYNSPSASYPTLIEADKLKSYDFIEFINSVPYLQTKDIYKYTSSIINHIEENMKHIDFTTLNNFFEKIFNNNIEGISKEIAQTIIMTVINNHASEYKFSTSKQKTSTDFDIILKTKSTNSVDLFQQIAIHAGYFCKFVMVNNNQISHQSQQQNSPQSVPSAIIHITNNFTTSRIDTYNHLIETYTPPSNINKIWCVTTDTGVFMSRRNGITSLTGNSSRAGQKGVIGMMYSQADMPFTKDGLVPDIIMNPQAIPSRMTIGQLLECISGKKSALQGTYQDATPFTGIKYEDITNELKALGYNEYGKEVMYNGFTGEKMDTMIFIGPTFYQRLKHMVSEKIHARGTGSVQALTRQPLEGRARDGGLRFGEMERDAMISHGTTMFLKERFYDCSDKYQIYVCSTCGQQAITNPEENRYYCKGCAEDNVEYDIVKLDVPYVSKFIQQNIQSMGISMRIFPEMPNID